MPARHAEQSEHRAVATECLLVQSRHAVVIAEPRVLRARYRLAYRPSAIWRLPEGSRRGSPGWVWEIADLGPATQRLLRPHPRSSHYRARLPESRRHA